MFHIIAKIFWMFLSPISLIILTLLLAQILRWKRPNSTLSNNLTNYTVIILLCLAILPVGHNLMARLEKHNSPTIVSAPEAIVVLGGIINVNKSEHYGQTIGTINLNRLTTTQELLVRYPNIPIYYMGGNGSLDTMNKDKVESDYAKKYFETTLSKQNSSRIHYERSSKNTYQNALNLNKFISDKNTNLLLITSAYHMPRSIEVFKTLGWNNVQPFATAYHTKKEYRFFPDFKAYWNIHLFHLASHEIIGIIAYELTGKTSFLKR